MIDDTEKDSKTLSMAHMHSPVIMSERTTGILDVWMVEVREFESKLEESCVACGLPRTHVEFLFRKPSSDVEY